MLDPFAADRGLLEFVDNRGTYRRLA